MREAGRLWTESGTGGGECEKQGDCGQSQGQEVVSERSRETVDRVREWRW